MCRAIAAAIAVALVVAAPTCFASTVTNVHVTLSGPDEGWAGDDLAYSAAGTFSIDQETQEEVSHGAATVREEYWWSYGPASCQTAPDEDASETFRFAEDDAPGLYTVSVTYEVTVEYADGTSDGASDTDSIVVQVKLVYQPGY